MRKQDVNLNKLRAKYGYSALPEGGTITLCTFERARSEALEHGFAAGVPGYHTTIDALSPGDVVQATYEDGCWHMVLEAAEDTVRVLSSPNTLRALASKQNRQAQERKNTESSANAFAIPVQW